MILPVTFKYEEKKLIAHSAMDGLPIEANRIAVNVLGQDFVENFDIDGRIDPKYLAREYALMFGRKLKEIGMMIEQQAKFGKPSEIIINEGTPFQKTIKTF